MSIEAKDLKHKINSKKEELNYQLSKGIGEDTLRKSRELDELIVKYMLINEKN